ncbi:MAG: hypothetical protein P8M78_01025 [Myxococcota bacterium]|nr:hypothetical protein [Myxococcota bacterium]
MEDRPRPIFSLREDDIEFEDQIDHFVIHLGEAVDALQDAESAGDQDLLDDLSSNMASQAAETGYPDLDKLARQVRSAAQQADKLAIQQFLIELTDLSRRIRLGHRGAA